jgi:murein DD-endopeptidase MepM/ murein hydrolase activator NlpD
MLAIPLAGMALLCLGAGPAPPLPGGIELRLPLPGACMTSPFGPRHRVGPHAPAGRHNGIDLRAPAGAWVTAAAAGRVAAVRHLGSSGLEVDIAHGPPGGGFITRYAHLGTIAPAIATGRTAVAAGDRLGRVGRTGVTYGTHLYFEILVDGHPIDPAPYLHTTHC